MVSHVACRVNWIALYLTKTGCGLPGKQNCEFTSLTNMDLKAVKERVTHCVQDIGTMDKPTTKHRKYIAPTLQNSVHRLVSMPRRTALLGIFAFTSVRRLNQSWWHIYNCAIYYVMQWIWWFKIWQSNARTPFTKFNSQPIFRAIGYYTEDYTNHTQRVRSCYTSQKTHTSSHRPQGSARHHGQGTLHYTKASQVTTPLRVSWFSSQSHHTMTKY